MLSVTRKRAQTMPVLTKKKLKDLKLCVALLPLAPESPGYPASPPAASRGKAKQKWKPKGKIKAAEPPPPVEHIRFTPNGHTYESYEEYKLATRALRERIRQHGIEFGEIMSTAVRSNSLLAMTGNDHVFRLDC
eukprot:TRINITY_DN8096_c0_g1_i2.p1 TRINITY_DN8096_c0_g1~~TRINITY_DN8096_c0_g1_i2.p1  ORF type:complete len:134 (+),score=11.94 TRINITY_DN8096_c0_g1_i2:224-625(+)